MELSRRDTKMLQGGSVLAMLCLHLFDRFDYVGLYQPFFFLGEIPLTFFFGQLSDFCVMGFAFCSGYGHMVLYGKEDFYRKRLKSLSPLLINYWIIILIFSFVSVFIGNGYQMPGSLNILLGNLLLYRISYNGAWWYMFTYVVLVIISPIVLKVVKKWNLICVLSGGFLIYCLAYYIRFNISTTNYIFSQIGPFGMTLFEYLMGAVCYKTKFFTFLYNYCEKVKPLTRTIISLVLFVSMLIGRTLIVPSLFIAPVTGFVIICIFHFWKKPRCVEKFFLFIGKHSTNIWLTHMFFYLTMFTNLVYAAKYPILIYGYMLVLTLGVSVVLQTIEKPIMKRFI